MDRWDVLALLGTLLLGAGLALLSPWIGLTAVGLVLLSIGIFGALAAERAPTKTSGGGS
ncbi:MULTISPECIES: hypothetical protein [unclassified Streptomyces]|uniref:hypothetical protein n=1 Tax=unclassified Streptomyces TaxID=2593676 RepID=UPI00226F5B72|nr:MULTISPECIES: hypothetical protein [unclassified Streptomyces]MCY0919616.1 hypothetical protein [Streptomyces sp. H27-G5]MCY0957202.1 hypothetical protein [Streptomyces sp. H27-H5]